MGTGTPGTCSTVGTGFTAGGSAVGTGSLQTAVNGSWDNWRLPCCGHVFHRRLQCPGLWLYWLGAVPWTLGSLESAARRALASMEAADPPALYTVDGVEF